MKTIIEIDKHQPEAARLAPTGPYTVEEIRDQVHVVGRQRGKSFWRSMAERAFDELEGRAHGQPFASRIIASRISRELKAVEHSGEVRHSDGRALPQPILDVLSAVCRREPLPVEGEIIPQESRKELE